MFKKILFITLVIFLRFSNIESINNEMAYDLYNKHINEDKLSIILQYLYWKQPSFFIENPIDFLPLNQENMIDFLFSMEPLFNFLDPLLWGNIVFPISLAPVAESFDQLLKKSTFNDREKYSKSNVVLIKGGTYPAMKKQLLYVLEMVDNSEYKRPIFLLTNSDRLNTHLYYESFDNIVNDLEDSLKRTLTQDELHFVSQNLSNEYQLALIISHFFNQEDNLTILDFKSPDPLLLEFNEYLKSSGYSSAIIFFVSNNIFTIYNQLKYRIMAWDNQELVDDNFFVFFAGEDIPLHDPVNLEGIFLRKLKMFAILYSMIVENIND
jgi:hypothetical protein